MNLATAIGSLPHKDIKNACKIMLIGLPEAPPWPQLPKRSFKENMYTQYSENLPCIKIDMAKEKIYFDTSIVIEVELEKCYERYLAQDIEYFRITEGYAAGFYGMIELLTQDDIKRMKFIKGHITGPISFGLTVSDENGKAILYNEMLFDTVIKGLSMKALWQIEQFKRLGVRPIIFLDEPYLTSFGSVYVNLNRDDAIKILNEVIEPIQKAGGITGIHCCGNTDWSLIAETKVDIINFDAYNFTNTLALYPAEVNAFLEGRGVLSWGIVPTSSEELNKEDVQSLCNRLKQGIQLLLNNGICEELLCENLIITPSCGVGSLSESLAEKAIELTKQVSCQIFT